VSDLTNRVSRTAVQLYKFAHRGEGPDMGRRAAVAEALALELEVDKQVEAHIRQSRGMAPKNFREELGDERPEAHGVADV
jgi:hypothetical protein